MIIQPSITWVVFSSPFFRTPEPFVKGIMRCPHLQSKPYGEKDECPYRPCCPWFFPSHDFLIRKLSKHFCLPLRAWILPSFLGSLCNLSIAPMHCTIFQPTCPKATIFQCFIRVAHNSNLPIKSLLDNMPSHQDMNESPLHTYDVKSTFFSMWKYLYLLTSLF